jgi:uroporphyrinogen decarboxylase
MDGIIMFSDILTPLPVLGIDFDVVKGTGPIIPSSSVEVAMEELCSKKLRNYDFDQKLPFIRSILETLSVEAERANTSLVGFVGAPFTLCHLRD